LLARIQNLGFADGDGVFLFGNFLLDSSVDTLWLQEDHRIRIFYRSN
jgi:hypothetical protein